MRIRWPESFLKKYYTLSLEIQKRFNRKIEFFQKDPFHPSLRVKRVSGTKDIWEASISMNYRWTFKWDKDLIKLRNIGTHNILNNP